MKVVTERAKITCVPCTNENVGCSTCFARKRQAGRAMATIEANRTSGFKQRFASPTLRLFLNNVDKLILTWQ